jgi:hypothetical protein
MAVDVITEILTTYTQAAAMRRANKKDLAALKALVEGRSKHG